MSYKFKKNTRVKIIKGRLKGETAVAESKRTDANWNTMIHIRRDNPEARVRCVQIDADYLERR